MSSLMLRRPRGMQSLFSGDPFSALTRDIDDLLGHFDDRWDSDWMSDQRVPSLDLTESSDSLEVKMDVPGMNPDDLDIQITGDMLTISGRHDEEKKEDDQDRKYHRIERRTGSFQRSVTLPCAVRESEVTAEYQDGVLTITLPRAEDGRTHRVPIRS